MSIGFDQPTDSEYRRRIEIWPESRAVTADLEDWHHHFRLALRHDATTILSARADDVRAPWTTCRGGASGVSVLVGSSIEEAAKGGWSRPRSAQCVHVVDLALLALAHVSDAVPLRYELLVRPAWGPRRRAWLFRNGEVSLCWDLEEDTITGPPPCSGCRIHGRDILARARQERRDVDPQLVERAQVLRRGCHMSVSALVDLDRFAVAAEIRDGDDTCWTYRPGVAVRAPRRRGTTLPLRSGPEPEPGRVP
jgi:hypothetical protein